MTDIRARIRNTLPAAALTCCALFAAAPGRATAQQAPAPVQEMPPAEAPMDAPPSPAMTPPVPVAPPPAPPVAVPAPAPVPPPASSGEPLAGFSDGTAFLRAPDNSFVLLPNGRLQMDGYFFKSDNTPPKNTFLLRRARLEVAGWVGSFVYFALGGDFAAGPPSLSNSPVNQTNVNSTDDFVALAPWGDLAILQFGQYDAPFTLENRTSDKYFDFMERSITVRAFGIPSNKEQGMMLHGTNPERNFYYSAGVFNGDGQNFRNVDDQFDVMGRAWVAPLSFGGPEAARAVTIGGSFWTGNRSTGLSLPAQSTQAGFGFLSPGWTWANGTVNTPAELHQQGRMNAFALELNAPIAHTFGARIEYVHKKQPLSAVDITNVKAPVILGGVNLDGWSAYGELWWWALGDDRIVGEPGMQLPSRFKKFGVKPPQDGVMLAARLDLLNEDVTQESDAAALMLKAPAVGKTKVTAFTFGVNYWHSKRFRATVNYVLNHFDGDTSTITKLKLKSANEHELLFRLAIAL